MAKFQLTNKAVADLGDIWNYTFENWSEKQADVYYKNILETCDKIEHNPNLGKSYNKIHENLLGFKVNKHIVFYRKVNMEEIEITRILHSRMDLKKRIIE